MRCIEFIEMRRVGEGGEDMKVKGKIIAASIVAAAVSFTAVAFNWPQEEIQSDKFYSYFASLRGGEVSTSLTFANVSDIKAAESGQPVVVIGEYEDDTCFFPSALGVAVILSHKGGMLSVYGNIDGETLTSGVYKGQIASQTPLGKSGNSAWQEGRSSLEFQVVDTTSNTAINPRSLMPRLGEEVPLTLNDITLEGKNGERVNLLVQRTVAAGAYRVYRAIQNAVPYRTRITINGVTVDEVSYDLLIQNDATVSVAGQRKYTRAALYPDNEHHLVGTVNLTPGKNSLGVVASDITGKETSAVYSLTVY